MSLTKHVCLIVHVSSRVKVCVQFCYDFLVVHSWDCSVIGIIGGGSCSGSVVRQRVKNVMHTLASMVQEQSLLAP